MSRHHSLTSNESPVNGPDLSTGLYSNSDPQYHFGVVRSAAGTAPAGVQGFPPALTSFIGRAGAVDEVSGLLDQYRLVTVTGPGGSGKTRLAGEVARRVAGRFADGVWLAELAAVADPALVASVVTAALRVRELPGVSAAGALARVLGRQQLLLVLDNCEHVIGAAAGLCAGLLQAGDDVRILATSREPLRVAGEARYRLAPLTLPGRDDLAAAAGCEAVALFTDRARRADMHFALDEETGPAVAWLVARLDGMPLAIELAAARVEALGVSQLLERIDERFGLLVAGDRLAADRQRSLAATVEWSYRLLEERERRVFRAVSVFPAGFTLEAAEAVAGAGAAPAVLRLVDCSLLSPPEAGPDGRSRYVMLETLRSYAAGLRDEAGEQNWAAAALAGYALRVAEQAAAGLDTGTGEVAAALRLDAEDATMRQALAWALDHEADIGLRLAVALAPWWYLRGRAAGEYLLREAADCAAVGSEGWCAAQFWLGWTALYSADLAGALGHFTAVRDAVGAGGPSRALADCLASRSVVLSNLARFGEAVHDGRQALAQARELGYPAGEALALLSLTTAAGYTDDFSCALRLARQAEQVTADLPGWLARFRSRLLAGVLDETGDLAAAEDVCAAGLARSREAGDLLNLTRLLEETVSLALRAGRADDAAVHLRELLLIAARTGGNIRLCNGLEYCGFLCAATGRHAEAVTVWAAQAALRQRLGSTDAIGRRRRQEATREARQALGPARARAAEERGAAMSQATAAEYALLLTGPQPTAAPGPGQLSARERELVTLVAQGLTDAQIAGQLYISVRTVRSHLDRIRDKTGCRRRTDLTRLALTAGLV
jgi:predicted ATPase/DNA-binding CsgD family transcriptional regulator